MNKEAMAASASTALKPKAIRMGKGQRSNK
jgi:hypothetical protein